MTESRFLELKQLYDRIQELKKFEAFLSSTCDIVLKGTNKTNTALEKTSLVPIIIVNEMLAMTREFIDSTTKRFENFENHKKEDSNEHKT